MKQTKGCTCSFCVPELRSGCFSPDFCKPCGTKAGTATSSAAKKKRETKRSPKRKS